LELRQTISVAQIGEKKEKEEGGETFKEGEDGGYG